MSRLAILGGTPLRRRLFSPWPEFDQREEEGLRNVLAGRNWGGFPFPNYLAKELGRRFAESHDARKGLAAANGTVTLEIALRGCGIRPGDHVILPAYTWEGTAAAVLWAGAVPIFVDCDPDTYCIDPNLVEQALSPHTRAVICVHLGMNLCDLDRLVEICHRGDLHLIEDCAHAHGSRWKGKGAGSYGSCGSFSFQTSKLMTAGEGGMLVTSDDQIEERCQSLINCGRAAEQDRFGDRLIGYNYRMTEFQAAVLLVQLARLAEQTARREQALAYLEPRIQSIEGIRLLARDPRTTTRACYQMVLRYDPTRFGGVSRNVFITALEAEGIPCDGMFYEPIYRSSLFPFNREAFPGFAVTAECPDYATVRCPVAERAAYEESIWIPHWTLLGAEPDWDDLASALEKVARSAHELVGFENERVREKGLSRSERPRA